MAGLFHEGYGWEQVQYILQNGRQDFRFDSETIYKTDQELGIHQSQLYALHTARSGRAGGKEPQPKSGVAFTLKDVGGRYLGKIIDMTWNDMGLVRNGRSNLWRTWHCPPPILFADSWYININLLSWRMAKYQRSWKVRSSATMILLHTVATSVCQGSISSFDKTPFASAFNVSCCRPHVIVKVWSFLYGVDGTLCGICLCV